jgi:cyanamide hydratase
MCVQEIAANGWTSMPANAGAIFGDQPFINKPESLPLSEIAFPFDDPTVAKALKYAKEKLHPETLNHSMRVYFYGMLEHCAQIYRANPPT